ncbi:MAG: hypothetical protein JO069_22965 [Verrucomicrobia bacterium]|nr:hypothetical protein [Verrucomicrobiota bacterium]
MRRKKQVQRQFVAMIDLKARIPKTTTLSGTGVSPREEWSAQIQENASIWEGSPERQEMSAGCDLTLGGPVILLDLRPEAWLNNADVEPASGRRARRIASQDRPGLCQ